MTIVPDDSPAARLDPEVAPPPHLKSKVERTLGSRGLLQSERSASRRQGWQRAAVAAAAALVLMAGSFWLGVTVGGGPASGQDASGVAEPGFVLLLYEDDEFRAPADEEAVIAEYIQWAMQVERNGVLISGEKLGETGTLLEMPPGDSVPLPAGEDVSSADDNALGQAAGEGSHPGRLTGYFVLATQDRSEALEIARTCPHLRYGGRIMLRPIERT